MSQHEDDAVDPAVFELREYRLWQLMRTLAHGQTWRPVIDDIRTGLSRPQAHAELLRRLEERLKRLPTRASDPASNMEPSDAGLLREARDTIAQMAQERTEPALVAYMTAGTRGGRSAAFLRTYAARVRDRSAASWEIPNTVATTLEDIAAFIEQAEAQLREAEAHAADEAAIVDRVWRALGITTMADAQGKSIDELVAELKQTEAARAPLLALVAAQQQLTYWWHETGRCPCGARRGDPKHLHVTGCPTDEALRR